MPDPEKLFPEHLGEGSEGSAVYMLQTLLLFGCYSIEMPLDGMYGPQTAQAVRDLQSDLFGHDPAFISGEFDSTTRDRLREKYGLDIDALTVDMFTQGTRAAPPSG